MFVSEADHAGRGAIALFRLEQGEEIPSLFFATPTRDGTGATRAGPDNELAGPIQKRAYPNVRFWHLADIEEATDDVCFRKYSGHSYWAQRHARRRREALCWMQHPLRAPGAKTKLPAFSSAGSLAIEFK